jgi:arylformamidase
MPTIDLEAEYNNRARVPEHPAILAKMDADAAAYRALSPKAELGLKYGPSERQVIDMFPSGAANAPLAMFIHGGYWRTNHWSSYSHMAKHLNARGIDVAVVGYDLCPQVKLGTIIDQMQAAVLFLWRKRQQRVFVFGHSAGGHLAACMVATHWKTLASDAPDDLVPAAYAISGLYDLSPMLQVSMNQDLRLDERQVRAASPLFWDVPQGRVLDVVVGGIESDEFRRQSRIVADGWQGRAQTRYAEIPGANHFTVIDPMSDPDSAMVTRLVELATQTAAIKL